MIPPQLPNSVAMLHIQHRALSSHWAWLQFLTQGTSDSGWAGGSLLRGNQWAAKHTQAVCCTHSLAGRSSDIPVLPAPRRGGRGWASPPLSAALWEDWHCPDRMWSVPEGEGSWLEAERVENVRCCFCLALGTDPAEIITEEFTLPCQICRYFAVLRFDVPFL